ncbi:MAG TPA: hypothetical protein VFE18_18340, partial [Phenylobacterium sp.]|uniref:hypothetical protein n=1 Tax=Phenylobacterium sp. TaxID=1871053 RepID=UPI002D2FCB13
MKVLLAAALAFSAATAANSQPAAPTAASVLAANRAAVGDPPARGAESVDYEHKGSGLTGPLVRRFDLATGA